MADTKITALTALTAADPANDVIPIVDVSDTTMAASGTTKKISVNNILGASGTATLASATITGDLTVDTSTLKVDSTNDRVGIGTATPAVICDVTAIEADIAIFRSTGGGGNDKRLTITSGGDRVILNVSNNTNTATAQAYVFQSAGTERYRIAADGVATWAVAGTTAMTLNSTGLGVGTASSGGSISNTSQILAGIFSTLIGVLPSVATATPTTIFAAPSESTLIVTAYVVGAAPSDYKVVAVVKVGGGVVAITNISTATSVTITASGTNIQVTQTSGGSQNVYFNVLRLS
jgi:hypothetical protein